MVNSICMKIIALIILIAPFYSYAATTATTVTGTLPTGTPPAAPSSNDSAGLTPPTISNAYFATPYVYNPITSTNVSDPSHTASFFANLPKCKNLTTSPPKFDINTPSATNNLCIVTKQINGTEVAIQPLVQSQVSPITSMQEASCPTGYVQIATFNMQPEIGYYPTNQTVFPIPDVATWNTYVNQGWQCGPDWNHQYDTAKTCITTDGTGHNAILSTPFNISYVNAPDWCYNQNGIPSSCYWGTMTTLDTSQFPPKLVTGLAVINYTFNDSTGYTSASNCSLPYYPTIACTSTPGNSVINCGAASGSPGVFSILAGYHFAMAQCTHNPGYFYTGNQAPASVVCSPAQSQWKSHAP